VCVRETKRVFGGRDMEWIMRIRKPFVEPYTIFQQLLEMLHAWSVPLKTILSETWNIIFVFGIESIVINDITSVPNFMKIYQAVQTLSVGDTQIDSQIGDLISLLSFLESRLKMNGFTPCLAARCLPRYKLFAVSKPWYSFTETNCF
jgi:hypothetical protein